MKNLVGVCLLLTAFIAVNAEDIPQDPVNIADEVEEDRDDIDDEDEEDRDDIDEEDEDEEDEEDRNELIDMNVEDRRIPAVGPTGIRCDAKALGRKIHTGTIRTNTALRCQELCGQWNIDHPDRPQCQVFTWRGRDYKAKWEKRRRCYLLTDLKQVKKRQYWCWGPGEYIQTTPTPNVGGNGEEVCEGHGYDEMTCAAIECCHFDDGQCWSSVGQQPCGTSG